MYSVRRKKLTPEVIDAGFPSVANGRNSGLSCG